jgi:glycosyltransferase involved in cell wall biosynthesis
VRRDVVFFSPYMGPLLASRASSSHAASTGGAETQVFLLAAALAERGWRVGVMVFGGPELPDRLDGVDILRLPRPSRAGARERVLSRLRLAVGLVRGLDARVAVQRAAGSATGLVGAAAWLRRRRFVYASASVVDFAPERLQRQALFRLGVRLADEVVVQSHEQVELCRRAFGREGKLIPSLAEPAPMREVEPEALLWVGRLTSYRRPEDFVALARALPDVPCWMVGSPSAADPDLPARIAESAVGCENLTLFEPTSRDRLQGLIERAAAVVHTAEFEGMSNVFLEAWARGVPALALRYDPDGVIDRHGLGWFAEGDFGRFASAAAQAWADRGDHAELARRCREYVQERHGIPAAVHAWEEALRLDGVRPAKSLASLGP